MHVRDRLRATLLQRRASHICCICAYLPTHHFPSIQAAATAKSFIHDNASRETQPHHAKRPPVTSPKLERLQHLPKPSASIRNGRSGHLSSGDDRPDIIPPEEDGRRGAQSWSSKLVPLLDGARTYSEEELYETLPSRKDLPGKGVNKTLWIRRYHSRESTEKTPRIRKYSYTKMRISKFPIASSVRLRARTVQSLGSSSDTLSNEDRTLPVVLEANTIEESPNSSISQASNLATFKSHSRHVKNPSLKPSRGGRSTVLSASNVRKNRTNSITRLFLIGSRVRLRWVVRRIRSTRVRRLVEGHITSLKHRVRHSRLCPDTHLLKTRARRISSSKSGKGTEHRTTSSRGLLGPVLRKVSGMTPATIKAASSTDDSIPVFVGRQRNRRYGIRDALGKEAHIQYIDPTKHATPTESKKDPHGFDDLTEPDARLLEDTEELLQLWQAPGPRSRDLSSRKATCPRDLTKRLKESTLTPPTSACEASQPADNVVTNRISLPYATSHGSAASSLGNQGLNGPLPIESWPAMNSKSYDISAKHLIRSPATIAARSLHMSTVCIETSKLCASSD